MSRKCSNNVQWLLNISIIYNAFVMPYEIKYSFASKKYDIKYWKQIKKVYMHG